MFFGISIAVKGMSGVFCYDIFCLNQFESIDMKINIVFYPRIFVIFLLFGVFTTAHAGLIVNVTDNQGFAQFNLSGSDTTLDAGLFANGFWIEGLISSGIIDDKGVSQQYAITSGSAGFTVDGSYFSFDNVWINYENSGFYDGRIGFRNTQAPLHNTDFTNNTHIELSGTIVTDIAFSDFYEGSYSFDSFGHGRDDVNNTPLQDGLVFNVGTVQEVPEPSIVALIGLCLLPLLGFTRNRRFI